MQAYVYLNNGEDNFFGFKPEHAKSLVLAARVIVPVDRHQLSVLDDIYVEFNVGGTYLDAADDYRERGHRSLSVGDVVVFMRDGGLTAFACASLGWEPVDAQVFTRG